jgi:hypothetical protein
MLEVERDNFMLGILGFVQEPIHLIAALAANSVFVVLGTHDGVIARDEFVVVVDATQERPFRGLLRRADSVGGRPTFCAAIEAEEGRDHERD